VRTPNDLVDATRDLGYNPDKLEALARHVDMLRQIDGSLMPKLAALINWCNSVGTIIRPAHMSTVTDEEVAEGLGPGTRRGRLKPRHSPRETLTAPRHGVGHLGWGGVGMVFLRLMDWVVSDGRRRASAESAHDGPV
jgi:hypothetical protein